MRAAWYDSPGPAKDVLKVGQLPTPKPAPGEVLVEVRASGINPSDYKRRSTADPSASRHDTVVPHSDGAGVVVDAGNGVDPIWVGRRVWIWNAINRHGYAAPGTREWGTAAEFVAVPLECVSVLPETTDFMTGACLGVPAFTAYSAVFADGPVADKTVLVQGGAGSVGSLAIQFAVHAGATVIATVSSDVKAERALDAGAHHVINYRNGSLADDVRKIVPDGVDRIVEVDFAANIRVDSELIKTNGTVSSYSSPSNRCPQIPYYDLQYKAVTVRTIQVFTMPGPLRSVAVRAINSALEQSQLHPYIAESFPLEQIAAAHEAAEGKPNGNIVLTM